MKNSYRIAIGVTIILITIFIVLFFNSISEFFFGDQDNINSKGELLKVVIQSIGGTVVLIGAIYSLNIAKASSENNKLIEKGNIAERFCNAISMLDSNKSGTCLGGIYALNEIAKDNSEYRQQVFNILVEFVNTNTKNLSRWESLPKEERLKAKPAIEIETIIRLLFDKKKSIYKGNKATFRDTKLYGGEFNDCNFSFCTFRDVEFQNSWLQGALFIKCEIYNTDFTFSDLQVAYFTDSIIMNNTSFKCCGLINTRINGCFLQEIDFSCSNISANFVGTSMNHCVLDGVRIVTWPEDKGSYNAITFGQNSTKALVCIGDGLIARGGRFNFGSLKTNFYSATKAAIGQKGIFKGENTLEPFPESKLIELENLIDINGPIKFYCHTVFSIKSGTHGNTGWIIKDLGEFTQQDFNVAMTDYDKAISKLK